MHEIWYFWLNLVEHFIFLNNWHSIYCATLQKVSPYYYYGPPEWTHKISIIHWQICGFPRSRPYNLPWSSFLFKHHPPAAVCVLGWSSEPCVYFGNFLLLCQRVYYSPHSVGIFCKFTFFLQIQHWLNICNFLTRTICKKKDKSESNDILCSNG